MNIDKTDLYVVLTPNQGNDFKVFFQQFNIATNKYTDNNIILNLNNYSLSLAELLQFKNISIKRIDLGTSFVIINKEVDLDKIPDELIIVPTFQEAIDMVEMDEMTRDLDF